MPVSFNSIPAALRIPGTYIEFDNSLAGNASINFKVLVLGQRLTAGTVAAGVPTLVSNADQADDYFGRGSMLAEQIRALKDANAFFETHAIALDEAGAGVAATGTITITGTATKAGTLSLYIAGRKLNVAVANADSATAIAAAIVAAVTADKRLPVTASNALGVVTLTCKWKGETGNDIDVRVNYYGEQLPAGTAVAIVGMASGTTNADITAAITAMGDEWYNWIVMPYTDATNLTLLETELDDRWGPLRQIGCRAFAAFRGNLSATSSFGNGRNNPHVSCMATNIAPQPPYIWAAVNAVVAAGALSIDPARPLQTLTLPGILSADIQTRFIDSERNTLLFDGIATHKVASDGSVMIERQITMYQLNGASIADDSYLDITTPETLERIRFLQRSTFAQKYPRHKLAGDATRVGPGQAIMQPKIARSELLNIYKDMEDSGWVQGYESYKASLVVEIAAGDPSRLNVQDSPQLVGQYRTHAQQIQFRR